MPDRDVTRNLALLGRAIQLEREEHGMTPAELAAAAGVKRRRLAALEAGRHDPTYDLLVSLAQGLGVRLSTFPIRAEALSPSPLLAPGERRLTPEEFEEHFGRLPTDGEG
jgi:transcriptional regulator with XRE-family HTH domain